MPRACNCFTRAWRSSPIGLLNVWLADQVRRAMEATRGQLLLERLLPGVARAALKDPLSLLDAPRSVEATLLVTDLRGFTSLSERMEPGDVFEMLNQLQGALSEAVHACGGIVDKFMGDGMLAVFGATEPGHDHARRAIEAVRRIRAALDEQNRLRSAGLRIGIGVHSGTVVAGCLGGGSRLEFTVIGDAVNTTSRLEAMTKDKGVDVLVSEETVQRVPEVTFEDLGVAPVRGRQQGIRVFTLKS
ncbi:adenylate/guanylate cyclase domain-containing protein [Polyangium sorediatum]|uniref:Adenylate/guanylate cyclase domain-containing protein n=1 Tax=Polyangium sorediatum TaxID=889274 RepID=A0ABT6NJA4_9BACT|nr:adenylate/guanylate cyclase domain-containing protein [Polyangium sorediatum]MDI1428400.1 adenylate/guanylate cyclase domain-containing protein [Polyangium sorediatum]